MITVGKIKLSIFIIWILSSVLIIRVIEFIVVNSINKRYMEYISQNKKNITLITLFIGMIVSPTIISKFSISYQQDSSENRVMVQRPIFDLENINEYPKQFESYYDDHLPFKNTFTKINSLLKYRLLGVSSAQYVIKGKEDWLFYNSKYKDDADTVADYMKTDLYTQEELESIKDKLSEKKNYLEDKGIELYVFIAPNKSQIYSEYMPSYYKQMQHKNKTEELVEYLKNTTDIQIIYPKEELINAKAFQNVYYKLDTHWNEIGAYVGFIELMSLIDKEYKYDSLKDLEIVENEINKGDLANMISLNGYLKDYEYTLPSYRPEIVSELVWQEAETILKYKSNNVNNKDLLMFRDSFATKMIPYLSKEYTNSTFIWNYEFSKELIEQERPDVVVIELVERYVDTLKN